MSLQKSKNSSPRIKIIQKIYNSLMNPNSEIIYPKNQFKKFIKDVVSGTLERSDLIEETINKHLGTDINLKQIKFLKLYCLLLYLNFYLSTIILRRLLLMNIWLHQNTF